MQTEKLPTSTPPGPSRPEGEPPEIPVRNSPAEQISWSDRVFWLCFIPAVVLFAGCCLWLSYCDIYGTARTQAEQRRTKVQVYIPPIKHPKKKPPPPPKVKPPPPKIVHFKVPPPKVIPRFVPHPPPPAPRAPTVGATVKTDTPTAVDVGPVTQAPQVAAPQTPGIDTRPAAPIVAPPAPPPPVIEKPAPPAPVYHAPTPPAPKPDPPKPKGYVDVDHQEAQVNDSSIPQVDTAGLGLDPTTINGPCVCSCVIDTNGRISGVRVRKSSGNADFDDACVKALRQGHGTPGVQDHILHEQQVEYTFRT